jgi:WD40 repeat protein
VRYFWLALAAAVLAGALIWTLQPSMADRLAAADLAWDQADPRVDRGRQVLAVALSPDGARLAVGGMGPPVLLFDAETGAALPPFEGEIEPDWLVQLEWSPDGRWFASRSRTGRVLFRDGATGTPIHASQRDETAGALAFHPTRPLAAWGSERGEIQTVHMDTQRQGGRYVGLDSAVRVLAFTPDEKRLVAGTDDGRIGWFDLVDGALVRLDEGHVGPITAISFAAFQAVMLTSGVDGAVRVWSFDDEPTLLNERTPHQGRIYDSTVLGSRAAFVSVGTDKRVFAWTFAGVQTVLEGHRGWITSVTSSADGARFATGGEDGVVTLWSGETLLRLREVDAGELIQGAALPEERP